MGLSESPDYTPEKTILFWNISFDLYRWSDSIDAFLGETWLRTVDCPEAYQTYDDVVDYLWRVLGVQKCDNPDDMQDQSTLLYALNRTRLSWEEQFFGAIPSQSCAPGYKCIARIIKIKEIPLQDKIKYVAWLNRWYISEEMIRFLSN